jgi:flagellar hook-length control protein FliK
MSTVVSTASNAADLLGLFAQGSPSSTAGTTGDGEFASQLFDAQLGATTPTDALPQSVLEPVAPSSAGQPTLSAMDATVTDTAASLVEDVASATIAPPAAQTADAIAPQRAATSATPTPPPSEALSLSIASESEPQVVSAMPPASADTTTPASRGRHTGSHRPATGNAAPAVPLLNQLPSPVPAITPAPGTPKLPSSSDIEPGPDDDSNAVSAVAASAGVATAVAIDSPSTTMLPTASTLPVSAAVDSAPAPASRPVSARAHVGAQTTTATSASAPSWFAEALRSESSPDVAVASTVAVTGAGTRWSSAEGSRNSQDGTTPVDASTTTATPPAQPATSVAPTVAASPVAAQSAPALLDQIARPIFTLRSAAPGEHVLTLNVAPEAIGPVTVRAHIGSGDLRVQLIAPNDESSAALNAILPDLKRDLAQGGINASVTIHQHSADLGAGAGASFGQDRNEPFGSTSSQFGSGSRRDQSAPLTAPAVVGTGVPDSAGPRPARSGDSFLDVLA